MMQVDIESRVMGTGGGEQPPAVRLEFEAGTIPLRELIGHVVARQIELLTEVSSPMVSLKNSDMIDRIMRRGWSRWNENTQHLVHLVNPVKNLRPRAFRRFLSKNYRKPQIPC